MTTEVCGVSSSSVHALGVPEGYDTLENFYATRHPSAWELIEDLDLDLTDDVEWLINKACEFERQVIAVAGTLAFPLDLLHMRIN